MKKMLFTSLILIFFNSSLNAQSARLPNFSLPDPGGTYHSSNEIAKNGLVLVVTAPTLHDKSSQEGWDKYLVQTMPKGRSKLVFIEDMSVSSFKGIALKDMKKDWSPNIPPLLLIDNSGSTRKLLGVGRDETKVFVYDKNGKLIYSDSGTPSASSAKVIWQKLK